MDHFDVLIVGGGISGIAAAAHLLARFPAHRIAILEAREELGGTWDLFRYPGVRSDSDMYSFAFSFRPWTDSRAIVDGASILQYLKDTAREQGLYERLRFGHAVQRASWSSQQARWTLTIQHTKKRDGSASDAPPSDEPASDSAASDHAATRETLQLSCDFLYMCTGYYDYAKGYCPEFVGIERFRGRIVHPQRWTPEIEHAGKRVVVIGSGATAMTLVPALAKTAAHVTLLQRSPSYVLAVPARDAWMTALGQTWAGLAAAVVRWRNILLSMYLFQLCRRLPRLARKLLIAAARRQLGPGYDVKTHFSPAYQPWDQRLCIVPDGDLFAAIRSGRASVVTDAIETFTESGVVLRSGAQLPAEVVVTATGLELQLMSNLPIQLDGIPVDASKSLSYRGMMFSGIPNLVSSFGYTNASWTLRSELTAQYVCRLLSYMRRRGYRQCCPRPSAASGPSRPLVELSSGYVARGAHRFPRQGSGSPWQVTQNYLLDWISCRWSRFADGSLEFSAGVEAPATRAAAREGQLT
jgi:monooxygenase